jgi:hypothetical protein
MLQKEGLLPYFKVSAPPSGSRHNAVTYRPGVVVNDAASFLNDFTQRERVLLTELDASLRRLSEVNIRVLGTHERADKTEWAIAREFMYLRDKRLIQRLIDRITSGEDFAAAVMDIGGYAYEAWYKSVGAEEEYRKARAALIAGVRDTQVREAIEQSQSPAETIWRDDRVMRLAGTALRLRAITDYVHLVARYRDPANRKSIQQSDATKLHELSSAMRQMSHVTLPDQLSELFEPGGSTLVSAVSRTLIEELQLVQNLIGEHAHDRWPYDISQDPNRS